MAVTSKRKSNGDRSTNKKVKTSLKEDVLKKSKLAEDADMSDSEDAGFMSDSEDGLDNSEKSSNEEFGSGSDIELDEEDDFLDAGEEEEESAAGPKSDGSDNKAKRQEQKKLQRERKLKKTHGKAIEEIKKLWEVLREKHGVSKNERSKITLEIMKLVDGKWRDLIFRHDASRVVQTVFKYADKSLRYEITMALKGTYVDLAKSAYGKYLLVKMLHYGSAKVRADIIDEMHGSFRKLMGHKEGAYVLEDCYRDYATAKQRRQIMREFYGSEFALFKDAGQEKMNLSEIIAANPEKKRYLLENLNRVITQAISKGSIGFEIVHAMMLEYIRNMDRSPKSLERETFIDLIADDFVEMVHTNAGSQVASLALAISTAKERKRLLKSLRQFPLKLAKDNYGNIVLMAAFLTVDDTKLTHKAFADLESELVEVVCDKFARRPFLMLLLGPDNTKYFGVLQQRFREISEFKKEFSKKDDEARRTELLEYFSPAINRTIVEHTNELVKENLGIQFILEFLLHSKNREPATIDAVLRAFDSDSSVSKSHPLNCNPFSGRVAKLLARQIPEFRDGLLETVKKYPTQWATSEGSFAVIALLEELENASALRKLLSKHLDTIKQSDAKGKEILVELITNGPKSR